jgi:hypothetical protein
VTDALETLLPQRQEIRVTSCDPGYRIESGVLDTTETGALLAALDALDLTRGRAGARHLMRHAPVHDVANDPRLIAIAREFLGPSAVPYRATLFDKSSARNWLITWHTDRPRRVLHIEYADSLDMPDGFQITLA